MHTDTINEITAEIKKLEESHGSIGVDLIEQYFFGEPTLRKSNNHKTIVLHILREILAHPSGKDIDLLIKNIRNTLIIDLSHEVKRAFLCATEVHRAKYP